MALAMASRPGQILQGVPALQTPQTAKPAL